MSLNATGRTKFYRTFISVVFQPSASPGSIRVFLSKYQAVVVGGASYPGPLGAYVIELPDPGPTLAALDGLVRSVAKEPAVRNADRLYHSVPMSTRVRYPVDNPSLKRDAWVSDSDTLLHAWRAIQAPMAWGCENGRYGSSPPKIGILDLTFAPQTDLTGTIHTVVAGNQVSNPSLKGSSDSSKYGRSHGIALAGILAAQGDNGAGIAGALWGANLNFYAYGVDSTTTTAVVGFWRDTVMVHLVSDGVQLFVTSTAYGEPSDTSIVNTFKRMVGNWQAGDAKRLFVYPLPNTPFTASLASVANNTAGAGAHIYATDVATAQLYQSAPGQVLTVTGSDDSTHALASFAEVWTGGTDIAAPAVRVLALARKGTSDFPNGWNLASGNSYAAPLAAGVAAQLMTFAPTLTADSIKYYLVHGAQQPAFSATLQSYVSPRAITGTPGGTTLYQLNAYRALQMYSLKHASAPVCGYDVSVQARDMIFDRDTTSPLHVTVAPTGSSLYQVSVAQGGRLTRVAYPHHTLFVAVTQEWKLQSGTWQFSRTVHSGQTVLSRMYLEKDTVDSYIDNVPNFIVAVRHASGIKDSTTFHKHPGGDAGVNGGASGIHEQYDPLGWEMVPSPAGDWIGIAYKYQNGSVADYDFAVVHVGGSWAKTVLMTDNVLLENGDCCTGFGYGSPLIVWNHTGTRVLGVYGTYTKDSGSVTDRGLYFRPATISGTTATVQPGITITGSYFTSAPTVVLSADDSVPSAC